MGWRAERAPAPEGTGRQPRAMVRAYHRVRRWEPIGQRLCSDCPAMMPGGRSVGEAETLEPARLAWGKPCQYQRH